MSASLWIAGLMVCAGIASLARAASAARPDWLALLSACVSLAGAWVVAIYVFAGG